MSSPNKPQKKPPAGEKSDSKEDKWYTYWQKHKFFRSLPNPDKQAYTVVMPPPNVTGILHMGHVLNQTVQDILVRRTRMQGKEVCWVPGIDHASIATEAKVIKMLEKKGLTKKALGREGFLEQCWQWKEKYGAIMERQLRRLGVSCDWERMKFTMDPMMSEAVIRAFVKLYDRGYIYRDKRIIHWDVIRKTALSNEEVIYKEEVGKLYHIAYQRVDGEGEVIIATTRPETIFGDVAICVHPEDDRYFSLHGKEVYVPLLKRAIPIIVDDYVDRSLGTGCLKVTPAHDPNDYEIGQRHGLPIIDIFTEEGKLHSRAGYGVGKDRFEVRNDVIQDLSASGQLVKVEKHKHTRGYSERSGAVVEPRISTQWFVRMKDLAIPAIEAVTSEKIKFYPVKFVNMYMSWMHDIRDWCISRQLWWGQRIPVYYLPDGRFVVATTREEAFKKASALLGNTLKQEDLQQDPDVLDTWFSSWLWPFSVFGGMHDAETEEMHYYYPTQDLVTAPEIIFFWVARMIMASYAFLGKAPFSRVYFTGIVRDKLGRKMSKSLGNSPDPLLLMDKYGVDGVRAGILFSAPAGNDLLFDEKLCEQGNRFMHKMRHAHLLVKSWVPTEMAVLERQQVAIDWFTARLAQVASEVAHLFENFRLSQALIAIYRLIWDDFCAHYLEIIKPSGSREIAVDVLQTTKNFFGKLMQLLHPFMPFVTEEIWQALEVRQEGASIMVTQMPAPCAFDENILLQGREAFSLIARVRKLKRENNEKSRSEKKLFFVTESPWLQVFAPCIELLIGMPLEKWDEPLPEDCASFIAGDVTFFFPESVPDQEALLKELAYEEGFLASVQKKLSNQQFLQRAPLEVVDLERKKLARAQKRIEKLKRLLH